MEKGLFDQRNMFLNFAYLTNLDVDFDKTPTNEMFYSFSSITLSKVLIPKPEWKYGFHLNLAPKFQFVLQTRDA